MPKLRQRSLRDISIVDLSRRIRRAREMDFKVLSAGQVEARIRQLTDGYMTTRMVIGTNGVFRARVNPPTVVFNNSRELWYPPKEYVERAGRFNRVGQSVFYASASVPASILEVRPRVGDIVTVMIAGSREAEAQVTCAHIGLHRCEDAPARTGANGEHPRADQAFLQSLRDFFIFDKWLRLDDYFTGLATAVVEPGEDDSIYKATNAIGECLSRIPEYEALLYPSLAANLKAVNMCLTTEAADHHFRATEAWMFKVISWHDILPDLPPSKAGYYEVQPFRRSRHIDPTGNILWDDPDENLDVTAMGNRTWELIGPRDF